MTMFGKTLRQLVADEAARLIYEEGYRDYRLAKQKASLRMGASSTGKQQPTNQEIQEALHAYVSEIDPVEHQQRLQQHREIALEALNFLTDFKPCLVGAALEGTSGPLSAITLHLSANRAEDVIFYLEEQSIPFQIHERKIRSNKQESYLPLLRFFVDDVEVELMIFTDDGRRIHSALNPINGKSLRKANYKQLKALLEQGVA